MIKKVAITALLCIVFPILLQGQGETSNWYFGNGAGIRFSNDGTVNATEGGQLNTFEGCATISDSAGNLLFYTDGILVYNEDHDIMENGRYLYGDSSSTQSAIIVPKPEDSNLFYIFTVDTTIGENDPDRGLNYSVVDISFNNGKGKVIQKNVSLLADCSEKIAAVIKDCSDQSIWIMTLASSNGRTGPFNTFHAYEVSTNGVNSTAIKSTIQDLAIEDPRGYLKISADGTKLASANASSGLFLYDFDAQTGIVSNQKKLSIKGGAQAAYGIEFSPNGRYLYVHASNDVLSESGHLSSLVQFDLEVNDIETSQIILDTKRIFRGALQLGENGKIYRTIAENYLQGTSFLSVINNPNEKGSDSNYEHNAISLGANKATQGLPPFIQSFFNKIDLITDANGNKVSSLELCSGEGFRLETEEIQGATYAWEKDGVPILNSNGNIFDLPISSTLDSGRYRLTVILEDPQECPIVGEAYIEIAPLPETSSLLLTQCDVEINGVSDGISSFDLEQMDNNNGYEILFYENSFDRDNDNPITNPQAYTNTIAFNQVIFYKAINSLGCENFGEVELQSIPTSLNKSILSPIIACDENADDAFLESTFLLDDFVQAGYENLDVTFYSNLDDLAHEENPIIGRYTAGKSTLYVRLENNNQCIGVEEIDLLVTPVPSFEFTTSFELCTDGPALELLAPFGFDFTTWYKIYEGRLQKISDNDNFSITEGGTYAIEVGTIYEKDGHMITCTASKDFVVIPSNKAVFQEIKIEDASNNNTIEVLANGAGDYEYSLDGLVYQDAESFENVDAGFYTVFARDKRGCGVSKEDISVVGFPKFFTPNGDGHNDQWQLIGMDKNKASASISIFDRLGKLMVQLNSNDTGWDGTFQGKRLPASDYWFKVAFEDGKKFKGHFSLKR